ncbi:MAG: preprotein translocase subunit YajC [Syntrophomonadaceae bacterium]|nr:preprotein translocase subunit YajC [Syntrophomonadaceae bacterium]
MEVDNTFLLYLVGFLALMWFLMIAPQRKKEKERRRMLDNLAVNDRVVTIGGIYGYIDEIREETVVLEIADGVAIEVLKNAIAFVKNEEDTEEEAEPEDETEAK